MSEYGRRIAAYGALAVVIATALSLGVVLLPSHLPQATTSTETSSGTMPACYTVDYCYTTTNAPSSECNENGSETSCGEAASPTTTYFLTTSTSAVTVTSNVNCSTMAGTNITLCSTYTILSSATTTCATEVCEGNWTAEFNITISYSGSWSAIYNGYNTNEQNLTVKSSGTGDSLTSIGLNAYGSATPTLCASVSKQDASNATLDISVNTSTNSTSASFGTATACATIYI
jgi:hypothetical protein